MQKDAEIRRTGEFWDFTSDYASNDSAYSNGELRLHTDTTYFDEPARLQMFHLLSHSGGDGGASTFLDGHAAMSELKRQKPAFETLANTIVSHDRAGNTDVFIRQTRGRPILGLKPWSIRWNNYDRVILPAHGDVQKWYNAAYALNQIINQPARTYRVQLQPGRPISEFRTRYLSRHVLSNTSSSLRQLAHPTWS